MEETKHTPGPWKVDYTDTEYRIRFDGQRNGYDYPIIVELLDDFCVDSEVHANAHLIAAAPELLAALRAVSRLDYLREHNALAQQVQAAIAKAEKS